MRALPPAVLLLAAVGLVAGSVRTLRAEEGKAPVLPSWKKGVQEGTVPIDGKEEKFVALVPQGYSPKKPCPAVLLLHGNGGTAADFLQAVRGHVGKSPLLLISLERCDNNQDAVGYAPKYLQALRTKFALQDGKLFALGFSGGGFRLWDDVVCKAEEAARFRGVVLVGSAKQSFDPPDRPENAPTVVLVGDPKDTNFGKNAGAAEEGLATKGYDVVVLEHRAGHSMPPAEMKEVFAWIEAVITGKKTALRTRRLQEGEGKRK